MLFIWAEIWRESSLLSVFLSLRKNVWKLSGKYWCEHTLSESWHFWGKSTFCIFSCKNISRKHFRKSYFVSCRFSICLGNKRALNTKLCENVVKWHAKFDKNFKNLKLFLNFSFFYFFEWSNCFYFFREKVL